MSLFLDAGVNRLSIGVQSFNENKLNALGRTHSSHKAVEAVIMAAKKGCKNIGIDLIFGVEGEDIGIWNKDLEEAVSLQVQHISCYSLTHEKNIKPIDDDRIAPLYERAISFLNGRGYMQYEISNFALNGYECRHNLNYWDNNDYIGIGPSAVSYTDGVREENISDLNEYMKRAEKGSPPVVSSERLTDEERARETAALKIRTMEGIGRRWFIDKTGYDIMDLEKNAIKKLSEDALIEYDNVKVRLTHKGVLFCDLVSASFV